VDSIINSSAFFVVAKGKPGGAERRFFYLCEYYLNKGDTPYLITNSELFNNLPTDNLLDNNIFKMKLDGHKFIAPFKYIFNSLSYIRKNNIKHVHFCVNPSYYSFFMVSILRLMGCTTSVSIVNSIIRTDSDLSPINQFVWKKTIKSVDVIDMLSPSIRTNMYNVFGSAVFHQKKISISLCSFSKRADLIRSEVRSDTNAKSRVYDFIFASRLIEGKGLDLLLGALELCDTEGHKFTIAICGNGPLANKVKGIKLNNIKLIYLDYVKDMQDVLFLSKVALSLQKYENYPSQFLLEALAANCNVISTDVGDTRLLLNEEISTLIANDTSSLKNSLIKTGYDSSLKRKATVNCALEHHSVESFANYMEKLIVGVQR
jgi:glycosyltransferase involved in cell wall biosynthesis